MNQHPQSSSGIIIGITIRNHRWESLPRNIIRNYHPKSSSGIIIRNHGPNLLSRTITLNRYHWASAPSGVAARGYKHMTLAESY